MDLTKTTKSALWIASLSSLLAYPSVSSQPSLQQETNMSVEKKIKEMVLKYILAAEGKARIMSPQDIGKLVSEAAHKGAMMGYDAGMQMARRSHGNELEIAELTVKELTERVKELETQMIAMQQ